MEFSGENIDRHVDTVIKVQTSDPHVLSERCLVEGSLEPCSIVIFGATGDLTTRKLAPALYNLYLTGALPDSVIIVGAARSKLSHDQFREKIRDAVAGMDLSKWDRFASSLYYQPVIFDSPDSFDMLSAMLHGLEKERNPLGNKIFYLATPPAFYAGTADLLGATGLSREHHDGNGWVRVVVEKPFGSSLKTAVDLNPYASQAFRRAPDLQDRSLRCQGNRSECPDVPLCKCDL